MCEPIYFKHDEIIMIVHKDEQHACHNSKSIVELCSFNTHNREIASVGKREVNTNVAFVEINNYIEILVSFN